MIPAVEFGLIYGVMALGVFLTFRILNFADLTVDGSFTTGGATAAVAILAGWNPFLAILAGFATGFAAGLITGLLHTKGNIDGLLAGRVDFQEDELVGHAKGGGEFVHEVACAAEEVGLEDEGESLPFIGFLDCRQARLDFFGMMCIVVDIAVPLVVDPDVEAAFHTLEVGQGLGYSHGLKSDLTGGDEGSSGI